MIDAATELSLPPTDFSVPAPYAQVRATMAAFRDAAVGYATPVSLDQTRLLHPMVVCIKLNVLDALSLN